MPAGQVEQLLLEEHRLEDLCGSVGDARVLAGGVEAQAANLDVLERGLAHLGPENVFLKHVFTKEGQVGSKKFQCKMSLKFKNLLK